MDQATESQTISQVEVKPVEQSQELSEEQKGLKTQENIHQLGVLRKQKQDAENDIRVLGKFTHVVENASYYAKDMQTISYGVWFLNRVVNDAQAKLDQLKTTITALEKELNEVKRS